MQANGTRAIHQRRQHPRRFVCLALCLGLSLCDVGWAGQIEPETILRKEQDALSPQATILGQFWTHTPAYYQQWIAAHAGKLNAAKVTREIIPQINQFAVAYLQLQRYEEALAIIERIATVDPNDYSLHANRSIIHARRALGGTSPDAAADWEQALKYARLARAASADPLRRDGLYLRVLEWLRRAATDPELRRKECLLGYNVDTRLQAALTRDAAAGVAHPLPLSMPELLRLLGEDPGLMDALTALVAVDSLAIADGVMAMADLCAAQGDLETAYFGYSRLSEISGEYSGDLLESRRQSLLVQAQAVVTIAPDRSLILALDADARHALDEQFYQRYLFARRLAQQYTNSYDTFELEQLKKGTMPSQRVLLDQFHQEHRPAGVLPAAEVQANWEPVTKEAADEFNSRQFLTQIAIWVPAALICAMLILAGVRFFHRYDQIAVASGP